MKKLYHNRHDADRPSNNDQLFRFRTLTSYCAMLCYAMLCFAIFIPTSSIGYAPIAMLPKHSLSSHSGRRISNSVTTIWFLFLIIYSFYYYFFFLWFVSFSNAGVIPYIFLLEAMLAHTTHLSSHELAYITPVNTSRFLWVKICFLFLIIYKYLSITYFVAMLCG